MIFSELYSAYYNSVSAIITKLIEGEKSEKALKAVVEKTAFEESAMTVLPSLRSGKWQLMRADMTTPIKHIPTMPLTTLQRRWLKAISLDPRIRLFGVHFEGLDNVDPLFTEEDVFIYDKYSDGDNYTDEGYIKRFSAILHAIKHKYPLHIEMQSRKGKRVSMNVFPERLEYSEKDDKFRLITADRRGGTVNLGRITLCKPYVGTSVVYSPPSPPAMKTLTLSVTDERNALERVMLHFAHFEKRAEQIDGAHYRLHIKYDEADEKELIIRLLSFGPLVKAEAPQDFVALIRRKLLDQLTCRLK